jgi:hypothetical protein
MVRERLNNRTCAKVGTAYSDHDQNIEVSAHAISRLLDTRNRLPRERHRKIEPPGVFRTGTGATVEQIARCRKLAFHLFTFMRRDKLICKVIIQF